ncbi:MAG: acetate--CoA ligase family protein, partial [Hyphomicrobiales bacterium]|nr:acetate--CoA ligase family protein [Hyphomicrobiales bacterium]
LARYLERPPARRAPAVSGPSLATYLQASARRTINEFDAKKLLAGHGIAVTKETLVASSGEAAEAARAIGFPMVLKAVSDDIPHKTEYGLVLIDLRDEAAVTAAWGTLHERLAKIPGAPKLAGVLVQQMIAAGIEVFAGVSRDPDFGHTLAFGIGGVAIEIMRDFALRLLPLRAGDAEAMIAETHAAKLLRGIRGGLPADIESLARCLYALADLAYADRALIAEIDLNPIKVLPQGQGCVVVDALIAPLTRDKE